jgi:hypothetical protein
MYNRDAESYYRELSGASTYQFFPAGDRYILGVSIQQSGVASTSEILCGITTVAKNYGKDFGYNDLSFHCLDAISVTKTGQDSASYVITVIETSKYRGSISDFNIASTSASVPINFASESGLAMFNFFRLSWISNVSILLSLGIIAFLLFMKRR